MTEHLRNFADAGVDQVIFIQQGGRNRHEDICASLELFADRVMPTFHAGEAARQAKKMAELAPYIEKAMARKQTMPAIAEADIPVIEPLGRNIIETSVPTDGTTTQHIAADIPVPLQDPLADKEKRAGAGDD